MSTLSTKCALDYLHVSSYFNPIHERIKLSTKIFKINKREKTQQRIFLLTTKAIYNIKPGTDKDPILKIKNNKIVCQRRIDLSKLLSITLSTSSTQFTINIPSEYDYRYEAFDLFHRKEIITTIHQTLRKSHSIELSIHKINQFSTAQYTVKRNEKQSTALMKRYSIKNQPTIRLSTTDLCTLKALTINHNPSISSRIRAKMKSIESQKKITTAADGIKLSLVKAPSFADFVQIGTGKIEVKQKAEAAELNDEQKKLMSPKFVAGTAELQEIQTETKPMEAERYYDVLINGYMRDIEKELKLIPDDIKAICIAYYYKFLVYNEYCSVNFQKQLNAPKLLIATAVFEEKDGEKPYPYAGRLVSRVPLNGSKSKVNIRVIETFSGSPLVDGEEFTCTAINNYYASVTDELDMTEGEKYTIMQTSPSGWWYAVNEDGDDGMFGIVCNLLFLRMFLFLCFYLKVFVCDIL